MSVVTVFDMESHDTDLGRRRQQYYYCAKTCPSQNSMKGKEKVLAFFGFFFLTWKAARSPDVIVTLSSRSLQSFFTDLLLELHRIYLPTKLKSMSARMYKTKPKNFHF